MIKKFFFNSRPRDLWQTFTHAFCYLSYIIIRLSFSSKSQCPQKDHYHHGIFRYLMHILSALLKLEKVMLKAAEFPIIWNVNRCLPKEVTANNIFLASSFTHNKVFLEQKGAIV